ncbi:MAG TPA: metallophosphoesterase, partial [Anaerolineales bacterium]
DSHQGDPLQRPGNIIELSVVEPQSTTQPSASVPVAPVAPLANQPAQTLVGDPVLVGAGDIASCSQTHDEATANLLDGIDGTVITVGDNVYPNGSLNDFNNCYNPTWGRQFARTHPAAGNHEYDLSGGAVGYYTYFGAAASPLDSNCTSKCKGYYSYDLGEWHIIVLNSNCSQVGGCTPSSPQGQWLQADLAAHPVACTLAYWHHPLFSSAGTNNAVKPLWTMLYAAGADVILNGHRHNYERFALQDPNGAADPGRGIREIIVGTGGAGLGGSNSVAPNSEVRNKTTWGVVKMTLHPTSYDWEFIPVAGQTFTDSGSAPCVSVGGGNPTPTPTPTNTPTPTPTPNGADPIFSDGFESGDLSAWTSNSNGLGDLSASAGAAIVGGFGLSALINDNTSMYVTDDTPNVEPVYRSRFYFDPNSISMVSGDTHFIFTGYSGTTTAVLRIAFRSSSGAYQIRGNLLNNSGTWINTSWFTISDAPHFIETYWRSDATNGGLTLWIDGVQKADLTGVANDTRRIDRVQLGAVSGIDTGTRGTYYFDAFESRRQTYIGP